jgi:GST-like protein
MVASTRETRNALDAYPHISTWLAKITDRLAVIRAYAKGEEVRPSGHTGEDRKKF